MHIWTNIYMYTCLCTKMHTYIYPYILQIFTYTTNITHQKQTHVHVHVYKLRHAKCVHTKHIQSYIYKYTTYIHGN